MCNFTVCVFACLYAPQILCCQGTICRSWFIFSARWLQGVKVRSLGLVATPVFSELSHFPCLQFFEVSQILEFWTVLPKIIYLVVEKVRWKWALFLQMSDYPHIFYDFWITFGNPLLWNLSIIPKIFRWSCFCFIYCTISCYFVPSSFLSLKTFKN